MDVALISEGLVRQVWRNATKASVAPPGQETSYHEFENGVVVCGMLWNGTSLSSPTPQITAEDVISERRRRLALGFDYNFHDARGVHHIGTSEADMIGWDEVTKSSQALIAIGQGAYQITVVTNTGPVIVTALEWQGVLAYAALVRQPIWAGSFALQAMSPIPADYATNEAYWVAAP